MRQRKMRITRKSGHFLLKVWPHKKKLADPLCKAVHVACRGKADLSGISLFLLLVWLYRPIYPCGQTFGSLRPDFRVIRSFEPSPAHFWVKVRTHFRRACWKTLSPLWVIHGILILCFLFLHGLRYFYHRSINDMDGVTTKGEKFCC